MKSVIFPLSTLLPFISFPRLTALASPLMLNESESRCPSIPMCCDHGILKDWGLVTEVGVLLLGRRRGNVVKGPLLSEVERD